MVKEEKDHRGNETEQGNNRTESSTRSSGPRDRREIVIGERRTFFVSVATEKER